MEPLFLASLVLLSAVLGGAQMYNYTSPPSLQWLVPTYMRYDMFVAGNPIVCPNKTFVVILGGNLSSFGGCDQYGNAQGELIDIFDADLLVNATTQTVYTVNSHIYPTNMQSICTTSNISVSTVDIACVNTSYVNGTIASTWSLCYGCYAYRNVSSCTAMLSTVKCYVDWDLTGVIDHCDSYNSAADHAIDVAAAFCAATAIANGTRLCTELGGSCGRYEAFSGVNPECAANCTGSIIYCFDWVLNKAIDNVGNCPSIYNGVGRACNLSCTWGDCPLPCVYQLTDWSPCSTCIQTRRATCIGTCANGTCPSAGDFPIISRSCTNDSSSCISISTSSSSSSAASSLLLWSYHWVDLLLCVSFVMSYTIALLA